MRVAAVGDIHVGAETDGRFAHAFEDLHDHADVLLLAGDLTKCGSIAEAEHVAAELAGVRVPIVAVLGNHDYHSGNEKSVVDILAATGVCVLEGESVVVEVAGRRLGIAGVKGFGGGFAGAHATAFGEPEMKAFVQHTHEIGDRLKDALHALDDQRCDRRVVLLHYSPTPDTLEGERCELYPFLGSQLLAEAIDGAGADLVLHGHAHAGRAEGRTPAGVPVRNVAMPVLGAAYRVFELTC